MFSTIDSPADRIVRLEIDTGSGLVAVAVPSQLDRWRSAVAAAPSADHLADFASRAAGLRWVAPRLGADDLPATGDDEAVRLLAVEALLAVLPGDTIRAVEPDAFDPEQHHPLDVQAVAVTVYRLEGDGIEVLEPTVLRTVTVSVPGEVTE